MQVKPEVCIVSLCGTQKEKGPAWPSRQDVSHRSPPPSQPVAARPMQSQFRGRGKSDDALLTCHDAPTSGNLLARRASLNGGLRSARTTGVV